MAKITVRDVPDEVLARLRERARDRGRSMEQEIREILAESAADWSEAMDGVRELRKGMKQFVSVEEIVRWQRQSRSGE
jgi:antitoxin FitA